jgi:hypothetical protein
MKHWEVAAYGELMHERVVVAEVAGDEFLRAGQAAVWEVQLQHADWEVAVCHGHVCDHVVAS